VGIASDVVFVQIPTVGAVVALGQSFSEVESTKSVSDIYAPLSGRVSQVNEALAQNPELLNSDPYGDGWICEIELSDTAQFEQLLTSSAYQNLIGG
jgi:glycine cleavage system H protein